MTIVISSARASALAAAGESNNPFVAWNNVGAAAVLGGSTVLTGGERANAVSGSTYDKWRPAASGSNKTLSFDFTTPVTISFAAIAAHNLFTLGGAASVQWSDDNVSWSAGGAGTITPTDNSPMAWRMDTAATARRYWRFVFTGVDGAELLSVGVAFMGSELVIPRRFYQGFSPVLTPTEVELQSNVSVGNELLGSSVIGRGSTLQATVNNVPATFVRGASWLSFQRHFNDGGGAFFGWRPEKYADDLHYIWRDGSTIRPTNSGPRDLMTIEMAARVYNAAT